MLLAGILIFRIWSLFICWENRLEETKWWWRNADETGKSLAPNRCCYS